MNEQTFKLLPPESPKICYECVLKEESKEPKAASLLKNELKEIFEPLSEFKITNYNKLKSISNHGYLVAIGTTG
jgi:hypothetical protein